MTPAVRFLPSVRLTPTSALAKLLAAVQAAVDALGVDLTITSGSEPMAAHGPTDPHTQGRALDISVRGLTTEQIVTAYRTMGRVLGVWFTVLYEVPTLDRIEDQALIDLAYVNPHATGPHFHLQTLKGLAAYPPAN